MAVGGWKALSAAQNCIDKQQVERKRGPSILTCEASMSSTLKPNIDPDFIVWPLVSRLRAQLEKQCANAVQDERLAWFKASRIADLTKTEAQMRRCIAAGDWSGFLMLASSGDRLTYLRLVWKSVPPVDRPAVFLDGYYGDWPSRELAFVLRALRWFARLGIVLADSEQARADLAALPPVVGAYRGTVHAEVLSHRIGTSWTLDRERAVWFAKERQFCNTPAVVLAAEIRREDVRALLLERKEREILVDPLGLTFRVEAP